ncbi:MAG: acetylxylan esterase [Alphaproteobacteria bacterium]|nr:acetylxylan esterase [Alphaproteobacteria bacterium]
MYTAPPDFHAYWHGTLDALDDFPMAAEFTPIPLRTTDFATLYGVRLTSIGPYRIFGYLSIPNGRGPFPAIYFTPRYHSVVQPVPQGTSNGLRRHVVTFSLAARGQRNADKPFAADFPGWLTTGITDPATYIFRGVVADSVRGLEFLAAQADVDPARIAVVGNDLAFMTAALGNAATHVATGPELFLGGPPVGGAYPRAEIADHLRQTPADYDAICRTLALYDLRAFAPSGSAKRMIMAGPPGSDFDGAALAPLAEAPHARLRESEQSDYKDGMALLSWLATQFGMPNADALAPQAWR